MSMRKFWVDDRFEISVGAAVRELMAMVDGMSMSRASDLCSFARKEINGEKEVA
ncbi:MAG: hypothetical protein Q8P82_03110 [bacterium]|nr:hypothetical protein [bacterium]